MHELKNNSLKGNLKHNQERYDVKFETWDKCLTYLFSISRLNLSARFSQHPSLPTDYMAWLSYPVLIPDLSNLKAAVSILQKHFPI